MHHRQHHHIQLLYKAVASHSLHTEDDDGPDKQLIDSMHLDNDLK